MEVSQRSAPTRAPTDVPARFSVDDRVWLVGIVLLAAALRFVAIGQHWGSDDGYSYLVASSPNVHVFLARLAAYENTPPLFYTVLALMPTGHSAWLLFPAAVPGVIACVVLYYALRRPLGNRAALIAALALAVSPFEISYSNFARAFMLADLALLVALWAVLRLSERESRRWWALYLVAGVIAVYSEYDSAIVLLALTLTALWLSSGRCRCSPSFPGSRRSCAARTPSVRRSSRPRSPRPRPTFCESWSCSWPSAPTEARATRPANGSSSP
jgi:uncharacterized membrane protein